MVSLIDTDMAMLRRVVAQPGGDPWDAPLDNTERYDPATHLNVVLTAPMGPGHANECYLSASIIDRLDVRPVVPDRLFLAVEPPSRADRREGYFDEDMFEQVAASDYYLLNM